MSLTNEILLDLEQRLGCEIDNKIKREKVLKKLININEVQSEIGSRIHQNIEKLMQNKGVK